MDHVFINVFQDVVQELNIWPTPWGDLYPCHQFVGEEAFKLGDIYTGVTNKKDSG